MATFLMVEPCPIRTIKKKKHVLLEGLTFERKRKKKSLRIQNYTEFKIFIKSHGKLYLTKDTRPRRAVCHGVCCLRSIITIIYFINLNALANYS